MARVGFDLQIADQPFVPLLSNYSRKTFVFYYNVSGRMVFLFLINLI